MRAYEHSAATPLRARLDLRAQVEAPDSEGTSVTYRPAAPRRAPSAETPAPARRPRVTGAARAPRATGPSDAARGAESRDFIASLARGLDVLTAFGPEQPDMNLSEVAARIRSAARRPAARC
jgi:IclR family pca regulon transcriptional regulator